MNSCISRILVPLGRAWHRFAHDDHERRAAVRHTRTSKWTVHIFTLEFLRQDYALLLWACRASKKSVLRFIRDAALEHAQIVLQIKNSGGRL
jgi:hypothetical protein